MADDDSVTSGTSDLDREWQALSSTTDAPREDAHGRTVFASSAGRGPRDWSAPLEMPEDEHFDGVDPDVAALYNQPSAPSHPLARWMWITTLAGALLALAFWIEWLPGGAVAAALALTAAIVCGTTAVILTAPREDRLDPTDDGARL